MHRSIVCLLVACLFVPFAAVFAQEPADPYAKRLVQASGEAPKALKRIRAPKELKVELWATEPMLANPVSFCFDEKGRCYVAETFRLHAGVTDNRNHMNWLEEELAAQTIADRIALYKKYLGNELTALGKEHDRVRLLEDTTGGGKADKATIFADGFNDPEDGLGAGVLARRGKVWYTCIPNLWLLEDTKGKGKADVKKSLHYGYGVHVSFIGHDSHGLKIGPDGKLYFSIGDRGFNVRTEGRVVAFPDGGAVLRCDLDGSNLEIVAQGLRNPQELVFDQYGNLFTGDNNADGGDKARWVYVVEGGDSGWRIGYQYLPRLGHWNSEKMWHKHHDGQPAHLVPPIEHIANGPSGVTYHPGVALIPERYQEHFFLVDFRGSSGGSGIHSFALKPRGAAFELVDRQEFVWSVLATDCDFGPDGAFYVLDWVEGWNMTHKGRIYKVFDADRVKAPAIIEVKKLLAEGMAQRSIAELVALLEHKDMRVRQEAQFALVEKDAVKALEHVAAEGGPLARLHAIWGLGQFGRGNPRVLPSVVPLLDDKDEQVRCQAAKVLGEGKTLEAFRSLVRRLQDASPRVRFFAAQALGKLGKVDAIPPLIDMIRANADADPYLRHAAVIALVWIADRPSIVDMSRDPSAAVRMASLLAMRRLELHEIDRFVNDVDPKLVLEAARAINDQPIPMALPALAGLLDRPAGASATPPEQPLWGRAINAHFRLGKKENAQALARFAARAGATEQARLEALRALELWTKPPNLDRFVGLYRPLSPRPATDVTEVLRPSLAGIMTGPDKVRAAGAQLAAKHGIKEIGPLLRELLVDRTRSSALRIETLQALQKLKDAKLEDAARIALADDDPRLRHQGRRILLEKLPRAEAAAQLEEVLDKGTILEKQGAFALLGDMNAPEADALIAAWLDKLFMKKAPADIQLDILEAARKRASSDLKTRLERYEASRPKADALARYREALVGGDAEAGKRFFFDRAELSCLRCHKVDGTGGEVGPDLTGIGKKQNREYLLESIVLPDKQIAKGYESVALTLANGQFKSGILKSDTPKEVRIMTAEGEILVIPTAQIEERARAKSAMPEDLIQKMSRSELRDLVEFLAGLK